MRKLGWGDLAAAGMLVALCAFSVGCDAAPGEDMADQGPPAPTAPPWSMSGGGADIVDVPAHVTRLNIEATFSGQSENFAVLCGIPSAGVLVNEILGTGDFAVGTRYTGTVAAVGQFDGSPCGEIEIRTSPGVSWSLRERR